MTVSHLARAIEAAGIPTVGIYVEAFEPTARLMKPPRVLLTPWPMGRPLGLPGDHATQIATLRQALALVASNERIARYEPPRG